LELSVKLLHRLHSEGISILEIEEGLRIGARYFRAVPLCPAVLRLPCDRSYTGLQ
jgi:hypothetical protein